MRKEWTFLIEPVAKGRARVTKIHGKIRGITPTKTRNYENALRYFFMQERPGNIIDKPVRLTALFYRSLKKSFTKKEKAQALNGTLRPTTKPDLSNYLKALEDAMNGLILKDDSLIVEYGIGTGKYYAEVPKIEIIVETLEN